MEVELFNLAGGKNCAVWQQLKKDCLPNKKVFIKRVKEARRKRDDWQSKMKDNKTSMRSYAWRKVKGNVRTEKIGSYFDSS